MESKGKTPGRAGSPNRRSPGKGRDGNVGDALRTVYDETVQENVPSEMLDLLSKLS